MNEIVGKEEACQALSVQVEMPAFLVEAAKTMKGVYDFAVIMSKVATLPAHLNGKPEDCVPIFLQAFCWKMDPFIVARCTSLVHGQLCYEGKFVAAVLQSLKAVEGRLEYEITGEGQNAAIVMTGVPRGGKKVLAVRGSVKGWRTQHYDKQTKQPIQGAWDKDPESMLVYRATRQWARLHAPGALLGVYTPDELHGLEDADYRIVPDATPPPARTALPLPLPTPTQTETPNANASPGRTGTEIARERRDYDLTDAPLAPLEPKQNAEASREGTLVWRAFNKQFILAEDTELMKANKKAIHEALISRLAKLHGAGGTPPMPHGVPIKNTASFLRDLAAMAADLEKADENLSEWERAQ